MNNNVIGLIILFGTLIICIGIIYFLTNIYYNFREKQTNKIIQRYSELQNLINEYQSLIHNSTYNKKYAPTVREQIKIREKLPLSTTKERSELEKQIEELQIIIDEGENYLKEKRIKTSRLNTKIINYITNNLTKKEQKIISKMGWF